MKRLLTILLIVMMVTATACNASSNDSTAGFQSDSSIIENETESGIGDVDADKEEGDGGKVIKPITGGGDFNAGKDY